MSALWQPIYRPLIQPIHRPITAPSTGPVWSPARLFSAGTDGIWLAPRDTTTIYQDSAGVTPWTAAGDPAGKVLDKSGNAHHVTQATTAKKPTTALVGSNVVLRGDGVDDGMTAGDALDLRTGSAFAVCVARFATSGAGQALFGKSEAAATIGRYYVNRGGGGELQVAVADGAVVPEAEALADTSTTLRVISAIWNVVTGLVTLRINSAVADTTAWVPTGADLNTALPYNIMTYDGSAQPLNGDFHELVQVMRQPAAGEIERLESYLAARHGVSLA